MGDGADPQVKIEAIIDPAGAQSGGAQTEESVRRIGDAAGAVQGPLTEAEAAAKKFGVSVATAQAALDRVKAQDKAAEVAALAATMREASAAATDNAVASETAADAEDTQAASAERLNNMMREHQQSLMRNAFYVHRLAEGFKDLSMGGRLAGQGMMDISESLQYMLGPEMAIYAAMAQVVAMLVMVGTMHRRRAGEAAEHADAEKTAAEKMKDAWSVAVQELDTTLKRLKQDNAFDDLSADAANFTQQLRLQEDATNALQAALDRLAEAQFGAKEQMLNLQEQEALQGKSGPEEKAIRDQFDVQRQQMLAQHEADKAAREQAAKVAQLKDLQDQLDSVNKQIGAEMSDAGDAQQKGTKSAGMTPGGTVPNSDYEWAQERIKQLQQQREDNLNNVGDADGNFTKPLTAAEWSELASLLQADPQLKADNAARGPQYAQQIDRLKKQIEDLRSQEGKDLAAVPETGYEAAPGETQPELRDRAAQALIQDYQSKIGELEAQLEAAKSQQDLNEGMTKRIDDAHKKISELAGKATELQGKIEAAKVDVTTFGVNVTTAGEKGQGDVLGAQNKQAQDQAQAKLDAQRQALETQINNLQALLDQTDEKDLASRTATEKKIADLQAKLDLLSSPNESPALAQSKANKTEGEAQGKIEGQEKKAGDAEQKQQQKTTQQDLERTKAQIDAFGNRDASREAATVLKTVLDKLVAQAELHEIYMELANGKFQEHDQALQGQQRQIDQLKRNRKNNGQQ